MEQKDLDYYNDSLISAVSKGNIEKSIEWIKKGASIHCLNEKNQSLLAVAALSDKKDMFDWLMEISQGGKKINLDNIDREGRCILHSLIRSGHKRKNYYLEQLIDAGANPNVIDFREISPLLEAAYFDDLEVAEILLKSPSIDVRYKTRSDNVTAFLATCRENNLEFVRLLNEKDPNVALDINGDGKSGLLIAISLYIPENEENKKKKEDNINLCKYLLTNSISDINVQAISGITPLFSSIMLEKKEIYEYLLANNVNANIVHNDSSLGIISALHIACMKHDDDLIRKLHANGAQFGVPDERNNTPEAYGFGSEKTRKTMLDLNADVNAFFYNGYSRYFGGYYEDKIPALSLTLSNGDADLEVTKEMIKRGAKVHYNASELDGKFELMPIVTSIISGGFESFKNLFETNELDINMTLKNDINLLMLALLNGETNKSRVIQGQKELLEYAQEQQEINKKNNVTGQSISEEKLDVIKKNLEEVKEFEEQVLQNKQYIINYLIENKINLNHLDANGNNMIKYINHDSFIDIIKDLKIDWKNENKDGFSSFVELMLHNKDFQIKEKIYHLYEEKANSEIENFLYNVSFYRSKDNLTDRKINNAVIDLINFKIFNYGLEKDNILGEALKEKYKELNEEYTLYIEECNKKINKNEMTKDEVVKRDIYQEALTICMDSTNCHHIDQRLIDKKSFSIDDFKQSEQIKEYLSKIDSNGNNAAIACASHGNLSLISLMHKLGIDIHHTNHLGETALMHVVGNNDYNGVRYLEKMGADFHQKRFDGKSSMDLAEEITDSNLFKDMNTILEDKAKKPKIKP